MASNILVIRADAGVVMGTGHVMRCVALAQAWQDTGGHVVFLIASSTLAIDEYLQCEGMEVIHSEAAPGSAGDVNFLEQVAAKSNAEWVVVDGYQFNSDYQRAIKQAGLRLLFVDDTGECGPYFADLILNQNITACEQIYAQRQPYSRLLLGTKYAMLRREFRNWREQRKRFPNVAQRILISIGGSDPDGLTVRLTNAFAKDFEFDIQLTVVAGGSNPRVDELQRLHQEQKMQRLLIDVRDMSKVIAEADLAILCGGGTLWETLFMGCPTLSYSRAGVTEKIIEMLSRDDLILDLGPVEAFDEAAVRSAVGNLIPTAQKRESMAERGKELVDGRGVSRVLENFANPVFEDKTVVLEPIANRERNEFLQMALDYFSELNPAFHPSQEWHTSYFESIQAKSNYSLCWIMHGKEKAGFVLFGIEDHRFLPRTAGVICELYVLPELRRKGVARKCAESALQQLAKSSAGKIQLEVVEGNSAAVSFWKSLGFRKRAESFVLQTQPDSRK